MKIVAVIPARYHSSRFPGKPLVKINNIPMIEWVYRQVQKATNISSSWVATDDQRIFDAVVGFGGQAVMTSPDHQSGSERIWEVVKDMDADAVINIQGDEPLISEILIGQMAQTMKSGKYPVLTAACFNTHYEDFLSPHVIKVLFDNQFRALYFSRAPIPYFHHHSFCGFYQHTGIYAYGKKVLADFIQFKSSTLENTESLEQLRFLENGIPIHILVTPYSSFGVDVPQDIARIEKILKENHD